MVPFTPLPCSLKGNQPLEGPPNPSSPVAVQGKRAATRERARGCDGLLPRPASQHSRTPRRLAAPWQGPAPREERSGRALGASSGSSSGGALHHGAARVAGAGGFPLLRLYTSRDFANRSAAFCLCAAFRSWSFRNCCCKRLWKSSVFLLTSSRCFTFSEANVRPYSHSADHERNNPKVMLVFRHIPHYGHRDRQAKKLQSS